MIVEVDKDSGFCFGVINAIKTAEKLLADNQPLYCLGDIVHNNEEVNRLVKMGLVILSKEQFQQLHHAKVLIRAHGEPPETYDIARKNDIELIDATCHVVLKLQKEIKKNYEDPAFTHGQILIFGKKGHAEVVGLSGQTQGNGIVLSSVDDLSKIDFTKPSRLYSQTTQSPEEYKEIIGLIQKKYDATGLTDGLTYRDTICRNVSNRSQHVCDFAARFDKVIFVSGEKSSNGLHLFQLCKRANPQSFFISNIEQIKNIDVNNNDRIGICGATSTPMWLMEKVREQLLNQKKTN